MHAQHPLPLPLHSMRLPVLSRFRLLRRPLLDFRPALHLPAGLLAAIFRSQALNIIVSAAGAALFAGYIVVDVQLMMGNGAMDISPDDYVFASLNIYLDVINLFLYILRILNQLQGDSR